MSEFLSTYSQTSGDPLDGWPRPYWEANFIENPTLVAKTRGFCGCMQGANRLRDNIRRGLPVSKLGTSLMYIHTCNKQHDVDQPCSEIPESSQPSIVPKRNLTRCRIARSSMVSGNSIF